MFERDLLLFLQTFHRCDWSPRGERFLLHVRDGVSPQPRWWSILGIANLHGTELHAAGNQRVYIGSPGGWGEPLLFCSGERVEQRFLCGELGELRCYCGGRKQTAAFGEPIVKTSSTPCCCTDTFQLHSQWVSPRHDHSGVFVFGHIIWLKWRWRLGRASFCAQNVPLLVWILYLGTSISIYRHWRQQLHDDEGSSFMLGND